MNIFSKIMFHLLEKPRCNCKNPFKQKLIIAVSSAEYNLMKDYLKHKNINYMTESHLGEITIFINDLQIKFDSYDFIDKKACVNCGTCLGWFIDDRQIKEGLYQRMENIIKYKASKLKKEIDEKELAKKICGEE